jgi:hypothetical protein
MVVGASGEDYRFFLKAGLEVGRKKYRYMAALPLPFFPSFPFPPTLLLPFSPILFISLPSILLNEVRRNNLRKNFSIDRCTSVSFGAFLTHKQACGAKGFLSITS